VLITETAQQGDVVAVFSYAQSNAYDFKDMRLKITRAGQVVYDQPIETTDCKFGCAVKPNGFGMTRSLAVRDLDADGEPEVLFDIYLGGAHCCTVLQAFRYTPETGSYAKVEHDFWDFGYEVRDLDGNGVPELIGHDGRFDYVFASFAGSGVPIQIWDYGHDTFTDVTRAYPTQIRRDAAFWKKTYRRNLKRGEPAGFLAAWAADESLLGREHHALVALRKIVRRHRLHYTNGRTLVKRVRRFLQKIGYVR
jgi:hypothetical protein